MSQTPYYLLPVEELAKWIDDQGSDCWWTVDGDPILTSRISFPCPGDELAAIVRKIHRPLMVLAKGKESGAHGQEIGRSQLDALVDQFGIASEGSPNSSRFLPLRWQDHGGEWLLIEDVDTTEIYREVQAARSGSA